MTKSHTPEAPEHLGEIAKETWDNIHAVTVADHFQPGDFELLATYCEAVESARMVEQQWRDKGSPLIAEGTNGNIYVHPLLKLKKSTAAQISALATKLRLCPQSRKAVPPKKRSKLDAL